MSFWCHPFAQKNNEIIGRISALLYKTKAEILTIIMLLFWSKNIFGFYWPLVVLFPLGTVYKLYRLGRGEGEGVKNHQIWEGIVLKIR